MNTAVAARLGPADEPDLVEMGGDGERRKMRSGRANLDSDRSERIANDYFVCELYSWSDPGYQDQ